MKSSFSNINQGEGKAVANTIRTVQRKSEPSHASSKTQTASSNAATLTNSSPAAVLSGNTGGRHPDLPKSLQTNLQSSFGHDFSQVAIQKNSQAATRMNALAFTQGERIHFAPGKFNPNTGAGRELIGHEFAHIVQQRSGAVRPTGILGKGLPLNDDRALENEADTLGKKAVQGESISQYRSSSHGLSPMHTVQAKTNVIQRSLDTWGGVWNTDTYNLRSDRDPYGTALPAAAGARGVDMKLRFTPNGNAEAEAIGLTQTAQTVSNGAHPFIDGNASREGRALTAGAERGTMIDRADAKTNPIYGASNLTGAQQLGDTSVSNNTSGNPTSLGVGPTDNATYQLGQRVRNGAGWNVRDAMLYDGPTTGAAQTNTSQTFETTALAIRGTQQGMYYGSVRWGWRTDGTGAFTKIPFQVISQGVPSATFMRAANVWNAATDSTGAATTDLPIVDVRVTTALITGQYPAGFVGPPLQIPAGTRVQVLRNAVAPSRNGEIRVVDGIFTSRQLEVTPADMLNLRAE